MLQRVLRWERGKEILLPAKVKGPWERNDFFFFFFFFFDVLPNINVVKKSMGGNGRKSNMKKNIP